MTIIIGSIVHVRRAIFIEHLMLFDTLIRWIRIRKFIFGIILSISVINLEVVDAFLLEIRPIYQK